MLRDWEFWLDNNISPVIAKWLTEEFDVAVKSAYVLKAREITDLDLYHKVRTYGHVIILTKDSDIPKMVMELGSPPKVIILTIGNCDNKILFGIIKKQNQSMVKALIDFDNDIYQIEL